MKSEVSDGRESGDHSEVGVEVHGGVDGGGGPGVGDEERGFGGGGGEGDAGEVGGVNSGGGHSSVVNHRANKDFKGFERDLHKSGLIVEFECRKVAIRKKHRQKDGSNGPGYREDWLTMKDELLEQVEQWRKGELAKEGATPKRLRWLTRKVPENKMAPYRETLAWVVNHIGMSAGGIDVDGVPCRGALIILAAVCEDAALKRDVIRKFLSVGEEKTNAAVGRDQHVGDLLGGIPFQGGDISAERPGKEPSGEAGAVGKGPAE